MSFQNFSKSFSEVVGKRTPYRDAFQTQISSVVQEIEKVGFGSFWPTDKDGLISYISSIVIGSLRCEPEQLLGHPLVQIFQLSEILGAGTESRPLAFCLQSRATFENLIVKINPHGDSSERIARYWRASGAPLFDDDGNFDGYRGSSSDVSEEFREQREVARQSQFDELTGLANRRRLQDRLSDTLDSFKGRSCAVPLSHEEILTKFAQGEWIFRAEGPPCYRADRISVYRKVGLVHEDHYAPTGGFQMPPSH